MHKAHIPSLGEEVYVKNLFFFLYTKILCSSFLLMLNGVPLRASKEGRNYPSSVPVHLAEWAIPSLCYSDANRRPQSAK